MKKKSIKMPAKVTLKKSFIKGSRIPISFLIDYIKEGYTLSEFISAYPWVKKEHLTKILDGLKDEKIASKYVL